MTFVLNNTGNNDLPNAIDVNLIVNFYIDKDTARQNEIEYCLVNNFRNPNINKLLIIVCDQSSKNRLKEVIKLNGLDGKKFEISEHPSRPTYDDYFYLARKNNCDINIVSNSDIMFDEAGITMMINYFIDNGSKKCMALSRWELKEDYNPLNATLFSIRGWGSQDAWVFYGGVNYSREHDFPLGKLGCDSKIAFLLSKDGYDVINPSKTIKIYHLHLTPVHNYSKNECMPKPYKYVPTSYLHNDPLISFKKSLVDMHSKFLTSGK